MNLKLWLITALVATVLSGGIAWHLYNKGVEAGKIAAEVAQKKHEKEVKRNDVKIDKKTPFDADRDAQLKWLFGYTVRQ